MDSILHNHIDKSLYVPQLVEQFRFYCLGCVNVQLISPCGLVWTKNVFFFSKKKKRFGQLGMEGQILQDVEQFTTNVV